MALVLQTLAQEGLNPLSLHRSHFWAMIGLYLLKDGTISIAPEGQI